MRILNTKWLPVILVILNGVYCQSKDEPEKQQEIVSKQMNMTQKTGNTQIEAVVLSLSEQPPESGILSTWLEVKIRTLKDKNEISLFLQFLSQQQPVPIVGNIYRFSVKKGSIDGLVGIYQKKLSNVFLVEKFIKVTGK